MEQEAIMREVFSVFSSDEVLLRYLYYPARNIEDDVLETDESNVSYRKSITEMNPIEKWAIINDIIKPSKVITGLADDHQKCRLIFYMGRRNLERNYVFSNQEIVLDILCHAEIDEKDYRVAKIHDHLSKTLFNKETKFGTLKPLGSQDIPAPKGYLGYQMRLKAISFNR